MKIRFLAIVSLCMICLLSQAQLNNPQIRMRIGYARSVVTSGKSDDNTICKMYDQGSYNLSGIGVEYAKPLKKNKDVSLLLGVFIEGHFYDLGINPEKFSIVPDNNALGEANSSVQLYAGLEKKIGKKELAAHQNYFSLFGGLGLSYNGSARSSGWSGREVGDGITTDGKYFQGVYVSNILFSGYYIQVSKRAAHVISPDIFAGLRWNIRNKKGNNAFAVELLMNYGLMTKFYLDISYTLDGQPASNTIKDKGVNAQLNLNMPLKNFGKKKR